MMDEQLRNIVDSIVQISIDRVVQTRLNPIVNQKLQVGNQKLDKYHPMMQLKLPSATRPMENSNNNTNTDGIFNLTERRIRTPRRRGRLCMSARYRSSSAARGFREPSLSKSICVLPPFQPKESSFKSTIQLKNASVSPVQLLFKDKERAPKPLRNFFSLQENRILDLSAESIIKIVCGPAKDLPTFKEFNTVMRNEIIPQAPSPKRKVRSFPRKMRKP